MSSTTLLSAYEQERLSNIAKNESKLRELGLLQSITPQDTPRDIPQEDKASKHGIHKEKRESLSEPRHRRKCTRLNSVDVDSGGLSDAFFRSEKWLTDDPFSTTIELETLETDLKKQKIRSNQAIPLRLRLRNNVFNDEYIFCMSAHHNMLG